MLVFYKGRLRKSSLGGSLEKGEGKRTKKIRIYRCEDNSHRYITIAVMMAKRIHLFPFRTQKLSSFTPKVLADNCREDR